MKKTWRTAYQSRILHLVVSTPMRPVLIINSISSNYYKMNHFSNSQTMSHWGAHSSTRVANNPNLNLLAHSIRSIIRHDWLNLSTRQARGRKVTLAVVWMNLETLRGAKRASKWWWQSEVNQLKPIKELTVPGLFIRPPIPPLATTGSWLLSAARFTKSSSNSNSSSSRSLRSQTRGWRYKTRASLQW